MDVSLEWLADFVEVPPTDVLVERLSMAGVAVEAVRDPSAVVQGVVVAQVETVEPHPEADRLKITTVFDGNERYRVVCGAPNVEVGMRVPYAKIGAKLPGLEITPRTIRGVESFGMLCGKSELALEEKSDGLWELPESYELGADVLKAAKIAPSLSLEITPNRPDLLSHVGVAREVAAANGKRMKAANWRLTEKGGDVSSLARVVVDDPTGCKRYVARVVRNIKVGPSPAWLVARLTAAGQRSINNVVDATNYVLMELGQPLHAFDLSRLASEANLPTVHVRRAKDSESLKLLDGTTLELDPDDLVIADAKVPVALAGVMGGADSEVVGTTSTVLLESAYFEPTRVRRTARRHGLHTEASHRFERGADPGICQKAVDRCAQLLVEIAGGEVAKGVLEVAQKAEPPREITLRLERVKRILGLDLPAETVAQLLEPLEIRCTVRNESSLRFVVPSFRPDLTREIDLIEEVVRRYGYERVPERLPDTGAEYYSEPAQQLAKDLARAELIRLGLTEIVTFGFGSPSLYTPELLWGGEAVRIGNPLGEEFSALRTSLLPGLLQTLAHNQRHGQKHVRLFEIGTVWKQRTPDANEDERDRDLPHEEQRIGVLLYGGRNNGRWYERGEQVDFSDLAGLLETLTESFDPKTPITRKAQSFNGTNPAASAALMQGETVLGWAAQVHPSLAKKLGAEGPVYAAELLLAPLGATKRTQETVALPKFPGTRRDVAIVAPRSLAAETVRTFILENAGGKLGKSVVEQVRLFDVYAGKPIPETHVSLAFAIDYRSADRTLTDAEVAQAFDQVQAALKSTFEVEVRSAS